ncbi:MAG: SGNH/GDSL hydrolase family protein [Planctomycetota bacterium]|nr:SGNH/GDSL hydrolase family protein [Planctomycetota bacterium]
MQVDYEKVFRIERYDPQGVYPEAAKAELDWRDLHAAPIRLSGFPWFEQERIYRRLPLKPAEPLPEAVHWLSFCTAGGQASFRTNSTRLAIRVKLTGHPDSWNITPVGQCGFDAYLGERGTAGPARARYAGSAQVAMGKDTYCSWLYEGLPAEPRTVTLNFPLYKGVERAEIGLDPGAQVSAPPPWAKPGPVIVYGTSITQGASASRPGMAFTNILSRRLNLDFVNLGFSGSGLCEPEVARTIAAMPLSHEPAAIFLDCDSNIRSTPLLKERHPAFLKILRARWPAVPLLVASKPPFMTETHHPEIEAYRLERRDFLKGLVEDLRAAGDARVRFQDGGDFYGDDWDECTVDRRHSTDLGFYRMAAVLEPLLRSMIFG